MMFYYFIFNKAFIILFILLFNLTKSIEANELYDSSSTGNGMNYSDISNSNNNNILMIRHGRSRVRHSSEKDHIRWGLKAFDNLTLDYEFDLFDHDNETIQFDYGSNSNVTSNQSGIISSTQSSNAISSMSGMDFTSFFDYEPNKVIATQTSKPLRLSMNSTLGLTHGNGSTKRVGKKVFMENIKKNVDKGLEYLKLHQNLTELNFTKTIIEAPTTSSSTTTIRPTTSTTTTTATPSTNADIKISYQNDDIKLYTNSSKPTHDDDSDPEDDEEENSIYIDSSQNTNVNNEISEQIDNGDDMSFRLNSLDDISDLDLADLDETSRRNRINLMKGRDVVTKFLQIVETQHLLGANCTAGTALNLGEGVVDRYAQDRFRVEAEVAVNRANMLTRIFKLASPAVQASEHLLHASVLSMVEFDDDIFAAGNCFDWNRHPAKKGLFCPFAYRLPPPDQGASLAKDLAAEYHYLGNTSEWFFLARKNAEKVIAKNEQYIKAYHLYSNSTNREADEILSVKYEDGRWSKPYYDCGGGNIWMLTYTVPFFGYENGTYFFKGTSGIDIDLRRVDIDQCPQRNTGQAKPLNIFAGTDKCKQKTTECMAIPGLGFRRGSYRCVCRRGFYFPDINSAIKYFNGSTLEEEYEKFMLGELTIYNAAKAYECLPCAEGCDQCIDASPCVAALNWPMRTSILVLACTIIGLLPPAVLFTFKYQRVKVLRAASPALLRVIALGAFCIYCTSIVMYPPPSIYTCTARVWLREIGFSLTYGALMLKTWRISVIFRVRSAKAVKITDASLLKRLGVLCCVVGVALLVRTIVAPPKVVVGRTKDDLKAFLCKTDWWDHTFTSMEVLFLAWGVRLCIMVRKAPSEFNESRFISMAIYNEFLLTCFLNVSMLFLQSPANPDLLYIIFFCHTQLTVTLLLALIFGSKVYLVFRGGGKPPEESVHLGIKSSGAKFICRSQARAMGNPSTATSSTAQIGGYCGGTDIRLTEQEALEEIKHITTQLQHLHERAPPRGIAIITIASLIDMCKTSANSLQIKSQILNKITSLQKFDKAINTDTNFEIYQLCDSKFIVNNNNNNSNSNIDNNNKISNETADVSNNCTRITITDNDTDIIDQSNISHTLSNLNFNNLELECMCSSTDDGGAAIGGTPSDKNLSSAVINSEHVTTYRYNKKFKISCKKGLHNFHISTRTNTGPDILPQSVSCTTNNIIISNICTKNVNNCNKKLVGNNINLDSKRTNDLPATESSSPTASSANSISLTTTYQQNITPATTSTSDINTNENTVDIEIQGDDTTTTTTGCSNNSNNSNTTIKRNKNSDNRHLVLDLNDRSKYTKEVSV